MSYKYLTVYEICISFASKWSVIQLKLMKPTGAMKMTLEFYDNKLMYDIKICK